MRVVILGVHPVPECAEPCQLIEVLVQEAQDFDAGQLGQEAPGRPRSDWQVAYDERYLNADGDCELPQPPVEGDLRVAFFLHYVDWSLPLRTPAGLVELPAESPRPDRLSWIAYESPG